MRRTSLIVAVCLVGVLTSLARAEWKEPENGIVTDQQFTRYTTAMKEWMAMYQAAGKAGEGQQGVAALGLWARTNEKYKTTLAKNNLTESEFTWISTKAFESWGAAMMELNWEKKGLPTDLERERQLKADLDAAKAKLARYEAAAKAGTKIITDEERKAAVDQAKTHVASIEAEMKDFDTQIKTAEVTIKKAEADAKAAEALADKPPATLSVEDRDTYIAERKAEAEQFRAGIVDANDQILLAKQSHAEAAARLPIAKALVENPEMPFTIDDKAAVDEENASTIKRTQEEITLLQDALKFLVESRDATKTQLAEMSKNIPRANIDLLKNRYDDFCQAMGMTNDFAADKK